MKTLHGGSLTEGGQKSRDHARRLTAPSAISSADAGPTQPGDSLTETPDCDAGVGRTAEFIEATVTALCFIERHRERLYSRESYYSREGMRTLTSIWLQFRMEISYALYEIKRGGGTEHRPL